MYFSNSTLVKFGKSLRKNILGLATLLCLEDILLLLLSSVRERHNRKSTLTVSRKPKTIKGSHQFYYSVLKIHLELPRVLNTHPTPTPLCLHRTQIFHLFLYPADGSIS